ncbi:PRC-barrel domain-containing protein [Acuticoccus sp.]|uniref:PRC-barrel domain-containing protein n=1 Tax=Acuticoccus sp. TaxID=1904378 RepID=UPI003B529921
MRIVTATVLACAFVSAPAVAQETVVVPETDIMLTAPTVEVGGYERVDVVAQPLGEDEIEDAEVWSTVTNENIGSVDDMTTDTAGTTYLELEIGGFLGIGDKEIIVPLDQVAVYRGEDVRVYIDATEEELEAYPTYEDDD